MSDPLSTDLRSTRKGRMRAAFETWIRRAWHPDFRKQLVQNEYGAYEGWDVQQAWFAFQAGWRRK